MELITNNENGILVEPGDSLSLSEAIMTLRGNPNLEYMQRRARTLARQMTWPVIAERYSELYERLLKQFVFLKKGV
jgi:glycosyltransferase involved in cell wall biosynthesis